MVERVLPSEFSIAVRGTSRPASPSLLVDPFLRPFFEDFGPLAPAERPFQAVRYGVIADAAAPLGDPVPIMVYRQGKPFFPALA